MDSEGDEELLRISRDQLMALRERTRRSLCRVIALTDDEAGDVVGSGAVLSVRGAPYLVTAQHVARKRYAHAFGGAPYIGLAHDTGVEGPIFRIPRAVGYDEPRDNPFEMIRRPAIAV